MIDQNFVSGIGNIYANEILYLSKINPMKKAKLLNKNEIKKIIVNSKKVHRFETPQRPFRRRARSPSNPLKNSFLLGLV